MGRVDRATSRRVPKNQIDPRRSVSEEVIRTSEALVRIHEESTKIMTLGKINFSGVTDFTPVPEGSYIATFKSWEHKQNSPDGTNPDGTHVLAQFVINDGSEYDGKQLRVRWALTEKALWRIRQDLIVLGADPEDLAGDDVDLTPVIIAQIGKQAMLDVKITTYKSKKDGKDMQSNEVVGFHEAVVGASAARR